VRDVAGAVSAGREGLDATTARNGELRTREPMPVGVALAVLPLHDVAPEGRRPGEVPDRERDVVHPHRRDSALRKVTATVAFMRAARDGWRQGRSGPPPLRSWAPRSHAARPPARNA